MDVIHPKGPTMSESQALRVLAVTCASTVLGALALVSPAQGVPQAPPASTVTRHAKELRLELAVERRVEQRELALTALFDAAERHAEVEGVRAGRLAALGYTGDVSDLEQILPLRGYHLSAGFGQAGPLWDSIHTGLDFGAETGTGLVAVADGTVTEVAYAGPYGIRTILTLEDGTEIWYCHQLVPLVIEGQLLEIGEPIGVVGATGNTTGPHLHLEVRPGGAAPIDPAAWFSEHGLTP